jgi:membrane protein implicated in regulation of membrane protease activity
MEWITSLDLENHWWWLIFAVLLGIGEILIPGVFLIWIAIAAALTGVVAMVAGIGPTLQIVLFAGLCLLATWLGRRWYAANPVASQDPMLNDRAARLVGQVVVVVEPIADGQGRVRVGDGIWLAHGPNAEAGARVKITGADGTTLRVEPV